MKRYILIAMALGAVASANAVINIAAFDNATVQANGPRAGASGKNFMNIEGSDNGTFASYGVHDHKTLGVDYGLGSDPVGDILSLTLSYTQQNAAFTTDGPLKFWIAQDSAMDIQPGTSPLRFADGGAPLMPLLLGTGDFVEVANGDVDAYTFTSFDPGTEAFLIDSLNNRTNLRFVVTPESGSVAATWAGFSNTASAGPLVSIEARAVPEPASMAVLGLGALALIRRRRSK